MNIVAIQTFLAVHRLGNLNRAAADLNVTQSAVTARLDALEGALGARLLNRSRKGATLTKAGYAFLEQATVIVRMWETARARTAFPAGVTRLFSLVCDPGLWPGMGREMVEDWRGGHPETAFEIWAALAADAGNWLASGLSDAALLPEPLAGPGLASRVLCKDRLVQVATQPRAAMRWDRDYVFIDYGPAFRSWHAEAWAGDETARMAFSNPDWALSHLLTHGGSAYLPERMAGPLLDTGQLFKVEGAGSWERRVILSWRMAAEAQFPWLAGPQGVRSDPDSDRLPSA